MTAEDLRGRLARLRERPQDGMSPEGRRLEIMAAERDVVQYLRGKNPPSPVAATKLAEIIVRGRLPHEEVGLAFVADPPGFELACRNPVQRLRYRLSQAVDRALGGR